MGALREGERLTTDWLGARLAPLGEVQRYWVAYSGGLDSSVLLHALVELRQGQPGLPGLEQLAAVHIDHGLHPSSAAWVEHCAYRCTALNVPLSIHWLPPPPPGASLESWARAARREVFAHLLRPGEVLLVAQHRDDQAETLLLALLRGSGPHGLAAMPELAPLGAGRLFRPLLDLDRALLADYAQRSGLIWIDDPSNAEIRFDRNYLRHRILPLLRARWPATARSLARTARLCAESAALADRFAIQTLEGVRGTLPGTLAIARLMLLDRPLCKAVIRTWIRQQGLPVPDARRLDRLLDELMLARQDANPVVDWSGCEIRRYRDDLLALPPLPPVPVEPPLVWRLGDQPSLLDLPSGLGRLLWEPLPGRRPMTPIAVQVRFGQAGLVCRVRPQGPRRALKKLFQEAGIPAWLRPHWPMLFCNERLVAIAGLAPCHLVETGGSAGTLTWEGCPWQQLWPGLAHPLFVYLS